MNKYYNNLDNLRKEYFKILSPIFPEWLLDYIDTPEIQRLSGISMLCGTDYSKIYNYVSFNSVLDHSVGVALIIWNFTKDKKQTLSGLFHDIATPTFKHCIDFMNGDSEHQESTEERTEQIRRSLSDQRSIRWSARSADRFLRPCRSAAQRYSYPTIPAESADWPPAPASPQCRILRW